ncbi:putative WWE domain, poly(ADP-ribose) polymerase, catalytic domain, RST domain-containing protein [Helianthus debilis subsp. tardiflorus]
MSSKIVKVSENGRRIFIDPKRKASPTNKSLSSRPPLNKLGKRKRANECENKFLKNYSNFMKSGLPQRLLFSQDGQWVDFSQEVVNLVKEDFRLKRAAIEVDYNGCHFMLDVLRMIQVDLKTGVQKPIAWIDDAGICVFPELYSSCYGNREDLDLAESSNTREVNLQLEIELNGLDNNEVDECVGSDMKVDFLEVKKCSSGLREAQLELFQKQVEITEKLRGNANVQYGWFAAAAGALSGVMFYGRNGPKLGTYGYGIHLAAVQSNSNHLSTLICDDDENGIKHMVLCRVILGNVEAVQAGSTQFSPSDQCFDSGVDDLHNPNNYIVWNSNMNTHIFPECVVSFKTSPTIKGTGPLKGQAHCAIAGNPVGEESMPHTSRVTTTHDPHGPSNQDSSSSNKMGKSDPQTEVINLLPHDKVPSVGSSTPKEPKSPWMPFSMLFEAISPKVAPNDMRLLQIFYESFRAKNINREEFIRKLRSVVGDQILRSTISVLQTKKNPNSASMSEAKEVQKG